MELGHSNSAHFQHHRYAVTQEIPCFTFACWPSCISSAVLRLRRCTAVGCVVSLAVGGDVLFLVPDRLVLDQQRPLPDRRSYMLTVRHALTRKLTRSKTMQWWPQQTVYYSGTFEKTVCVVCSQRCSFISGRILWCQHYSTPWLMKYKDMLNFIITQYEIWLFCSLSLQLLAFWINGCWGPGFTKRLCRKSVQHHKNDQILIFCVRVRLLEHADSGNKSTWVWPSKVCSFVDITAQFQFSLR